MPLHFRHPLVLCVIVTCAGIFLCAHELARMPDGRLHVYFFDVGQGDSALIVTPSGKQIIIDGGPDDSALTSLGRTLPFFDRTIDMLVLTHPELDHISAFPEILRRYRVGRIVMTGIADDLPRYREFLKLIREQKIPVWIADPARDIDFGDGAAIDIVWPPPTLAGTQRKDLNNTSIVLRVMHASGGRSATGIVLFTGDMEEKEEKEVLASGADLSAGVLKMGHHGSKTSSGTGFLLAVHPRLAIASAGRNNSYGHPHKRILDRFRSLGIPVRVTAIEGTIELTY